MGAGGAVLDPADVQHRAGEVDLVPAQVADLGRAQSMPEGQQDHGGVAVAVPVAPGGFDQRLDLADGECSRVRRSAFLPRFVGTVRKISVGVTGWRCDFAIEIQCPAKWTVCNLG